MERKYTQAQLDEIRKTQHVSMERGLPVLVKPAPGAKPGQLDPRVFAQMKKQMSGLGGFIAKNMIKKMAGKAPDAQQMRKMMNGIKSIPVTSGVNMRRDTVAGDAAGIPIRIYTPEFPADGASPALYYIHGGGFVAGRFEVVEELCKLFVQKTGWPCVSVEYRLAPEHPYPAGLDDCFTVLRWVYENAPSFGGDPRKICVAGDSAGGNLAAVCTLKDRDGGTKMVAADALLYPTLNMAGAEDEDFHFSIDEFHIVPEQRDMVMPMLTMFGGMSASLGPMLGVTDVKDPYLSPYLADLSGLPPFILLYGEFDYLKVENEAYARKMLRAGGDVTAVRYSGQIHAFGDMVGVQPQAEDCVTEMADFMRKHLG